MIAVMCRCSETKKLFGIRFYTNNGKKWKAEWAFPLKESADKRGKGYTNPAKGSFDVGEEYPGCPNCGNPTFFCVEYVEKYPAGTEKRVTLFVQIVILKST